MQARLKASDVVWIVEFGQGTTRGGVVVGAGVGEVVIIAQGSSARQTKMTFEKPIDAVVAGIVDLIEEKGTVTYRK